MLKLRLKKIGRKNQVSFELVVAMNTMPRNSSTIELLGYYNTITKEFVYDRKQIIEWINRGAKPTIKVKYLLNKLDIFN